MGENLVQLTGKIVQARPAKAIALVQDAFITSEEIDELGVIHGSREDKELISELDPIYVKFKDGGQAEVGKIVERRFRRDSRKVLDLLKLLGRLLAVACQEKCVATQIGGLQVPALERSAGLRGGFPRPAE